MSRKSNEFHSEDTGSARLLSWRAPTPERYAGAFDRALQGVREVQSRVEAERTAARHRASRLLRQPPSRRRLLVGNHRSYAGWWLASLLLDEAEQRLSREPQETVRLAGLAGEAVENVQLEAWMLPLAADLRARACRLAAEGHRHQGDTARARREIVAARLHLCHGSGEPLERALVEESRGNLLAAEGRPDRAELRLRMASERFRRLRDHHLEGRALLAAALLTAADVERIGQRARAVDQLRRGLALLEPGRDRPLAAAAARRLAEISFGRVRLQQQECSLSLSASPMSA